MNFFTWLMTKRKTLATMSVAELRAQEMLRTNERDRMHARMQKLAGEKHKIIESGAKEKTPELRTMFAQQFDQLHTEQMMIGRQLNLRSKELLTVSRLRMLRENAQAGRTEIGGLAGIRESDLAAIEHLIENDSISTEMYQERLDEILQLGHAVDQESAGVSPAAQELLKIWNDMDAGLIKDTAEAADEAERRVRERQQATEG